MLHKQINIIRSDRKKTATINIKDGKITVRVPKHFSDSDVSALIARRKNWIEKTLAKQAALPQLKPKQFVAGEVFLYLGRELILKLDQKVTQIDIVGDFLLVPCDLRPDDIRHHVITWYMTQARNVLQEKTKYYINMLQLTPTKITVKHYKARWGSCTADNKISFNYQIVMAPPTIIDYLVVHELCHIKEHNHSPAFWCCVEQAMPDYKERRLWLKNFRPTILN